MMDALVHSTDAAVDEDDDAVAWFGVRAPSAFFFRGAGPLPPLPSLASTLEAAADRVQPPPPPLHIADDAAAAAAAEAVSGHRRRQRQSAATPDTSSRYGFVCESADPPPPSAFAGLLGTLTYARHVRHPTRWWVVAFLKTNTRPRRHLTPAELLARLEGWGTLLGPLLLSGKEEDARAFATFERNLRRQRDKKKFIF